MKNLKDSTEIDEPIERIKIPIIQPRLDPAIIGLLNEAYEWIEKSKDTSGNNFWHYPLRASA